MPHQIPIQNVSEATRKWVISLNCLNLTLKSGYAPFGLREIQRILLWKGGYVQEPSKERGRETIRTWLRLFTDTWENPPDEHFRDVPLNLDLLREALLQSDGFYGAGINWVRYRLGFTSINELAARIRALPVGDAGALSSISGSPSIQHYAYDAVHGEPLVFEISKHYLGGDFGLFWYRGDDRNRLFVDGLKRVLSDVTPIIPRESVLVEPQGLEDTPYFV